MIVVAANTHVTLCDDAHDLRNRHVAPQAVSILKLYRESVPCPRDGHPHVISTESVACIYELTGEFEVSVNFQQC
jgi:hypothetical protein